MNAYEFTLRFALPSADADMDSLLESLAEEGCDDALIGIGVPGRIALDFNRSAASAREAVFGAIGDVRRAVPGAVLIEATPDLVGVTDIADVAGCSRQNIRQLMAASGASAPVPVHESKQATWHLAPVLDWLARDKNYEVDRNLRDLAEVTMQVNIGAGAMRCDANAQAEIRALFA